jgi:hypothetical protein
VAAALSGAAPNVPKVRERWTERLARPLLGVGIAATVAVVAIGALRSLNEASVAPGVAAGVAGTQVQTQTLDAVAPSYVVPPATDDQSRIGAPIRLTNYLMHHGEFASGLTRTSVNSNVVGAELEPVITDAAVVKPLVVEQKGLE